MALRRAAEFAQVWQPTPMALADLRTCQAYLREACAKRGRQDVPATRMSRVNFSEITGSSRGATAGAERPIGQGPQRKWQRTCAALHEASLEAFQINFNGCHNLQAAPGLDGPVHAGSQTFSRAIRHRLMPQTLAAMLPYIPPGLARALLADPTLAPLVEQFAAVLFADISGFTPLTGHWRSVAPRGLRK